MNMRKEQKLLVKICAVAMMAAIVFVGNYLRVKIPVSLGGTTSFTLANILCALAGLLLGPWWGALASGIGSALFDLTNPAYVSSAPITLSPELPFLQPGDSVTFVPAEGSPIPVVEWR